MGGARNGADQVCRALRARELEKMLKKDKPAARFKKASVTAHNFAGVVWWENHPDKATSE